MTGRLMRFHLVSEAFLFLGSPKQLLKVSTEHRFDFGLNGLKNIKRQFSRFKNDEFIWD